MNKHQLNFVNKHQLNFKVSVLYLFSNIICKIDINEIV